MKKFFSMSILAVVFAAVTLFTACGGNKDKEVPFSEVKDKLVSTTKSDEELLESDLDMIEVMFGIPMDQVENYYVAFSGNPVVADEITLFEVKDSKNVDDFKEKLQAHLDSRASIFEGYAPVEADKLQKSTVLSNGKFVAVVVSLNPDEVAKAFKDLF